MAPVLWLSRLADVQRGEGRSVLLMTTHAFAMGLATVLFETAASALFLAQFGSRQLPFMYLAAAALSILTGLAYSALERRASFGGMMTGTLAGLAAVAGGLRLGLSLTSSSVLVFSLLVWYRLVSILTDLEYWAVAGRLYDVRQAKRLFGVIGSGEVAARIVGAFSVPLLLRVVGVADLLLLSSAALVTCLVLVRTVLREAEGGTEALPSPPRSGKEPHLLRRLAGERYVRLLLTVAAFGVLGKYLVDFAFLEQMRARHAEAGALATFFGLFSGLTQAGSLLVRLLVSGRLLRQRGVAFGLMVLPVAHSLCSLALLATGVLPGAQGAVFWLVIANQGLYKTLKHPIDNASFKVLYQPLAKAHRLAAQIAVETILTPATVALAAGLMWFFSSALRYDPVVFAGVMLAGFVPWAISSRLAGRAYGGALLSAVRGRLTHDETFSPAEAENLARLRRALDGGTSGEVLFALEMIEQHAPESLDETVIGLLRHAAVDVRRAALERISRRRIVEAGSAVRALLGREKVADVLIEALRALAILEGDGAVGVMSAFVSHPQGDVRRGALVGLIVAGAADARGRLAGLAVSADAAERALAARVIGEAEQAELGDLLAVLLRDPERLVRQAALNAARRVRSEATIGALLAALRDRPSRRAASGALVAAGAAALPALERALGGVGGETQERVRLLRVVSRVRGDLATRLLLRDLSDVDPRIREAVLESPIFVGRALAQGEWGAAEAGLTAETALAQVALPALERVPEGAAWRTLRQALRAEVGGTRGRILRLLGLLHDPEALGRVRENLDRPSRERRAYAFEVLEISLPMDERERFGPLIERMTVALHADGSREVVGPGEGSEATEAERILRALLRAGGPRMRPWTRISALVTAARLGTAGLAQEIRECARDDEEPLVRDAARWALAGLSPAEGGVEPQRGRAMETIEKVIYLKGVRLFAQAPEDVLLDVAAVLEEVEVPAGSSVFRQGARGDSLYILVAGSVRVHTETRTIGLLGPHDVFGEMALLEPEPRAASVSAETDVRLLRLDREAFAELLDDHIEIVRGVVGMLCERLRQTVPVDPQPPASPSAGAGLH